MGKVKVKIYTVTHKKFKKYARRNIYQSLLVGANKNKGDEDFIKDNSFEGNISDKNSSFCELTGQYWIYKESNEDIVGLCHYRRYFTKSKKFFPRSMLLNKRDIINYLSNYDIILPQKGKNQYNGLTAKEFFCQKHDAIVWQECREIIKHKYPNYLEMFDWFENETEGYSYNMLICNKELFDSYSEWLFSILFDLEDRVDLSKYDNYNSRMFGFVSERLINVWVKYHNLKVKEVPVVFTESKNPFKTFLKSL